MQQHSDDFPMIMEREAGMREDVPPVAVSFGLYPSLDNHQTKAAGHDVYKDVEFVKIAVPGDRNSLFFQPSNASYRERFPRAYADFKQRDRAPTVGMPIEQWAPISRSVALTLRAAHIDTVEALAAVHDGNLDRLGSNMRSLREKARAWLADAATGAEAIRLAGEKQALQDQITALQAQITDLATIRKEVETPEPAAMAESVEAARGARKQQSARA